VYVGTDANNLSLAASVDESSFDTSTLDLALGQGYSWRVDEVNDAMDPSTWASEVWSFTTVDTITIDDMERYKDEEFLEPWNTWVDGFDDPSNGSLIGVGASGAPETDIVHGGSQSLPMGYDHSTAAQSEAMRTFDAPMDWTAHGVQGLVIYFHGSAPNTGGSLYVKINGTKVAYDGDPAGLMRAGWSKWYIPLAEVAGDLSRVTSLTLGIDGGGMGIVYFDDIHLTADARELVTPVDPGTAGLLAHYALDGDAADSSGNGLHGAVVDGTFVASSLPGQGMSIQLNDAGYVDLGNPPLLGFSTGDWTVSAWFKTDVSGTGDANKGTIFAKGGDTGGGHRYALIMSESIEGRVSLVCDDNVAKLQAHSTSVTNDSEWHAVVGLRDGMSIHIFIDGFLETSTSLPDGYDLSGTVQHNAYIGTVINNGSGAPYKTYIGEIDEVRVYDRALSAGEAAGLAGHTSPFDVP
jgi:hypothetical protein